MINTGKLVRVAEKIVEYGFYALAFLVPLVFTQLTYELFEFPKMISVYVLTIVITSAWAAKSIVAGKVNIRRTPLDKPILALLAVNILATLFSIDSYTSVFGYYTRFNGGLLSLLAYVALYYIFAWEIGVKRNKGDKFVGLLLLSALFVSFYGVLQHFGVDKDFWVQDVQRRVFSTLGQPNWLAAFLLMVIPVSLALQSSNFQFSISRPHKVIYLLIPLVLYSAFWFTYSRSGLLGFAAMMVTFLVFAGKENLKRGAVPLVATAIVWIIISAVTFTPTISGKIEESVAAGLVPASDGTTTRVAATPSAEQNEQLPNNPTGSTIKIRLAVWKGTLNLVKDHPLLGTGPETFAYSFLPYRPVELNQTAEWDFLYNKAHNEYLNIAATTGLLGLASYLWLIVSFIRLNIKNRRSPLSAGIFAGWVGLLVSNFFGFGVVATSLLFWLYMALGVKNG